MKSIFCGLLVLDVYKRQEFDGSTIKWGVGRCEAHSNVADDLKGGFIVRCQRVFAWGTGDIVEIEDLSSLAYSVEDFKCVNFHG